MIKSRSEATKKAAAASFWAGTSKSEVAKRYGVTSPTITAWIGKYPQGNATTAKTIVEAKNPSKPTLAKIAAAITTLEQAGLI